MQLTSTVNILTQYKSDKRFWILGHFGYINEEQETNFSTFPKEITSLRNIDIQQISCGGYHCLILTTSGEVLSFGWNKLGQLGLGHNNTTVDSLPEKISCQHKIVQVEASGRHSLLLTNEGKVLSFGLVDPETVQNTPTLIQKLSNYRVNYISTGFWHNIISTACGRIFVSGKGDEGKLGLGNQNDYFDPVEIKSLKGIQIRQCDGGAWHTVLLDTSGRVFCWGSNFWGQLGLGESKDCLEPTELTSLRNEKIIKIACGSNFTICLTEDGKVFSFGCSSNLKIGHKEEETVCTPKQVKNFPIQDKIVDVQVGSNHTIFLTETKKVMTCGWNKYGQLGHQNVEISTIENFDNIEIETIGAGAFYTILSSNTQIKYESGLKRKTNSFVDVLIFTC
jgi:E3 ubiquitin-protein ligase HERC1